MLEKLLSSKARVKILNIFLLNPEEKFYIRQLSRQLKLQLNSVRRELDNLEKFGILTSNINKDSEIEVVDKNRSRAKKKNAVKTRKEKKYYQVNPDFVLFEEIKALIMKAQILYEKDFIRKLEQIGRTKLLILTGIFVNQDKAIDMLIVGRFNKKKLQTLINHLEHELGKEINYTLMDNNEFKFRKDITDVFLYDILEGKKIIAIDKLGLE